MPFLLLSLTVNNNNSPIATKTNISKVSLLLLLLISIIQIACDKNKNEEDNWKNCTTCTIDSWVGEYSGKGDYRNFSNGSVMSGVDLSITIEETATDYLTIYFLAPNVFSTTVSGDLATPDIILFAGSSSSVTATMFTKDGVFRLTGSAKKFHYQVDSLIVDQVVTFETTKVQ